MSDIGCVVKRAAQWIGDTFFCQYQSENRAAMKAFVQMLRYIWPQWPRIIVVVLSAMAIAAMLSLSFVTIIPLLKVMIGTEGLHGWVDRKTAEYYYGLEFYVPDTLELTDGPGPSLRTHLLVTKVGKGSLAERAGIRPLVDYIADVNNLRRRDPNAPYLRLLEELAAGRQTALPIELERKQAEGKTYQSLPVEMRTPYDRQYVASLDWKWFRQFRWRAGVVAARGMQRLVTLLPREQTAENKVKSVLLIVLAIGATTVIRCIAKYFQDYLGQKIVEVGTNHLREDVFERLMRMPIGAVANEKPSDLISRIVRDTVIMGGALRVLLGKALREPMNAVAMLAVAMYINWHLTLIFLAAGPLVLVLFGTFGSKMRRATRRSLVASSQMLAKLQEAVAGLRVIKVYNQEQHEQKLFRNINDRLLQQLLNMSKVDAATQPVLEVLGMAAGCAALVIGMDWVAREHLDGAEFLGMLVLLGAAAESVRKISDIWNKIQQSNAAAERIFAVLEQPVEVEKPDAVVLPPMRESIEFQEVTFSYPGAERPAVDGINLVVPAGRNVALVGPNGSGKTTLASLLPRFYDPDAGRILIDGHDIRDITLRSLRSHIGMVTQQVISFNDTIAANIGYGRQGAGRAEIVAAAKRAYAHEFVSQLPKGYETIIGEQGVGLSGGQLQRIVIARAILKNPAILIFDEATSQIDADSEAKIHAAIEQIMQGRTTFIIAHRFSTVIAADMIVVMNEGHIIAQGQHEELMQTCPIYQALYETQLIKA
jgi:ABC-type multidrug transport system fused ATPase/permease subunit